MQSRNISSISSIIQRIFLQNFLNQKSLKTNTLLPFQKKKQKKKENEEPSLSKQLLPTNRSQVQFPNQTASR